MSRAGGAPVMGTIRSRILALFFLAVSVFGGAMGYNLVQLQTIGEGVETLERGYLPLAKITAEMAAQAPRLEEDVERDSPRPILGARSDARLYNKSLAAQTDKARQIASAGAQVIEAAEAENVEAIHNLLATVEENRLAHLSALDAWENTPAEDSAGATRSEVMRRQVQLTASVGRLSALVEGRIEQVSARTAQARDRAYNVSIGLTVLAGVITAVLTAVALVTLRPIASLTEQVQRLGAGDFSEPVDVRSRAVGLEVAVLAREFNAMAAAVVERDRRLSDRAAALDRLSLRLRQVLDAIRAGLVVSEGEDIELVNPSAQEMWRVLAGGRLPGWLRGLSPGQHEAIPNGARLYDVDVVAFGRRGLLIVGEDVTQRVEVRERLARAERLAVVGQMLAQITHEVRNPLNAMSLNAELLADELDARPEAAEMLETIIAEIRRLEQLTARYLSLSRRRTPELSLEDPIAMVREVLRLEEEALRRAQVAVRLNGAEVERLIELDGDAMRRALRNVLLNAVEAGAQQLEITVQSTDLNLEIAVRDDGPGMEIAQTKKAFEPFFTTKAKGTGLGLAISRQELEEVGGALRCESAPGAGSTFTLVTPLSGGSPAERSADRRLAK
ncbi:MAG: ATP-binding protein [Myxococcota bacterium]